MNRIFVQIAAYRDPQLVPTIRDCIANASFPEALVFCIAWQRDQNESLEEFAFDPRVKVIDIPYRETRGACWARNLIQSRYEGEEFTLALDSHHRFVPGWDAQCIEMIRHLQRSGSPKPLLTTYAPPFLPDNEPDGRDSYATIIEFVEFAANGVVSCRPGRLHGTKDGPVRARFLSAHFIFTLGQFCVEVPHDPNYYFHGEEINLAVRAYTHGYDLFHPHVIICWHEYIRKARPKQWDDDARWHHLDQRSHLRNRRLFGMEDMGDEQFGSVGFGTVRSLRDYERYAGLHFARRSAQQHTVDHGTPPNPESLLNDQAWEDSFAVPFHHTIKLDISGMNEEDYDFWSVIYLDGGGLELYRLDVSGTYLSDIRKKCTASAELASLDMSFPTFIGRPPKKWIVWPHSISKSWCERSEGDVDYDHE